ncbi:MAG: hypothetical protein BGO54_07815 [Sphingobacteriales bacterium 46-32]|nr:MAG: hypothetical protein BGO54_07815 [Sphingobacteriales bacterium 46-32]
MQIKLLVVSIFVIINFNFSLKVNDAKFSVSIERKLTSNNCIQGYLSINGSPICYTMELPYRGNINDISSIPKGKYDAVIRTDKKLGWKIELLNVPNREHIQIHLGNYTSDITGCTLVGKSINTDNCSVGKSKDAIMEIERLFKDFKSDLCLECNSSKEYEIEVEYK